MSESTRQTIIDELDQTMQRVGNRTVLFTHVIADHVGLSATEFECLDFIRQCGPVPAGRLAQLTGLTTGAVTGLIDRLERAGFLCRQPDAKDRRRILLTTVHDEAARAKIKALYQPVADQFSNIAEHYSNDELQVITRFLHESLDMIDRVTADMEQAKRDSARQNLPAKPKYTP